jgi:tRNA threonylcarbamoyladenosine biosynthesis protein TsaB
MPKNLTLLALDTSTHRMSVGLVANGVSHLHEGEGGAQASAALLPAVFRLLAEAGLGLDDLDALAFGRGPGAFTGLRTACAVVQGLAYGVRSPRHPEGLPVLAIDTLAAVAESARQQAPASARPLRVTALLDARMGEIYAATYRFADARQPVATRQGGPWLLRPHQLADLLPSPTAGEDQMLAGNALALVTDHLQDPELRRVEAWPHASALLGLAPALWASGQAVAAAQAQPLYVRDKVAQTTEERTALARTGAQQVGLQA